MIDDFEIMFEVNEYLYRKGVTLKFSTIQDLLDSYISCKESVHELNSAYCKTLQQIRQDIEKDWVASLEKDCYTISQLEKMTLAEIAELIR